MPKKRKAANASALDARAIRDCASAHHLEEAQFSKKIQVLAFETRERDLPARRFNIYLQTGTVGICHERHAWYRYGCAVGDLAGIFSSTTEAPVAGLDHGDVLEREAASEAVALERHAEQLSKDLEAVALRHEEEKKLLRQQRQSALDQQRVCAGAGAGAEAASAAASTPLEPERGAAKRRKPTPGEAELTRIAQRNECSICLEVMVYPVTLACQHKGCRTCLRNLQTSNAGQAFKCPICRQAHTGELVVDHSLRDTLVGVMRTAGDDSYATRNPLVDSAAAPCSIYSSSCCCCCCCCCC